MGRKPWSAGGGSLVFKSIRSLEHQYHIDTKRVYVAGTSMGGYGSWHFISVRPDLFAAAIAVCGAGDTSRAKNITGIPVWAFHGEKDSDVPVARTREMIASMQKAGGHPKYTEFPGAGHNITAQVYETPGLLYWLFAQRKN